MIGLLLLGYDDWRRNRAIAGEGVRKENGKLRVDGEEEKM